VPVLHNFDRPKSSLAENHGLGETKVKPLFMRYSNLDAIVTPHQNTVLRPAQVRDADREPDADRQEGNGERESRHIRQHALPIIVIIFSIALIMG
jgi:hypothetical protein